MGVPPMSRRAILARPTRALAPVILMGKMPMLLNAFRRHCE